MLAESECGVDSAASKDDLCRGLKKAARVLLAARGQFECLYQRIFPDTAVGTIGLFEGADYFHCGVYRPEFDCRMRNLNRPFCAVCQAVIMKKLTPFLPK